MTIDYKQLQTLVKEAMFTGGGINEPSAPAVPHRMPAADNDEKEQDKGDPKANNLYEVALTAREATEKLVEALDEPIYDDAYEHAFKASACLRKALNSLEDSGAHPMPDQRVVAPAKSQQPYGMGGSGGMNSYSMGYGDFGGGVGLEENIGEELTPEVKEIVGRIQDLTDEETKELMTVLSGVTSGIELDEQEQEDSLKGFGTGTVSKSAQAKAELEKSKQIASGDALDDVDTRERAMLLQIEKILTDVAEKDDLAKYRPAIEQMLKRLIASASKRAAAQAKQLQAKLNKQ
jgi:hypothetical protein